MSAVTRWIRPIVVGALVAIAVIAVFHMQLSAANYDPQYMRVLVERTIRLGGSYYENGIHNKGPLEPAVYEFAGRIGGRSGFWFVIAIFTLVTSLVIGVAAALAVERSGGTRVVGFAVAVMAVTHLTLSDSDYAGVLYSRNITVGLLALAFVVGAWDGAWRSNRRRIAAVLVAGLAIGLAVQTLLSACFTAVPVLAWVVWTRRHERVWSRPVWLVIPLVAAAGFLSAPIYYRIFGPWQAFVDGWWTYAHWMNTATGRSLGGQFGLGVDQFADYYGDRPILFVVIVAFMVEMVVRWRALDGSGRGTAGDGGRMVAGGMDRARPQPALFIALLFDPGRADDPDDRRARRSRDAAVAARPGARFDVVRDLGAAPRRGDPHDPGRRHGVVQRRGCARRARSTGVGDFDVRREQLIDGRTHMVRAALDLVSEPDDPLLMWTSYPWPYLNLHRVPATRYIWKNFLLGEIYLARSGPQYVLPGTWETFAADVERTDPAAFYVEAVNPVVSGTPFDELVDDRFTTVFTDEAVTLAFRDDLATWLRSPPDDSGSSSARRTVDLRPGVPEVLEDEGCVRLDGDLVSDSPDEARATFGFGSTSSVGGVAPAITVAGTGDDSVLVTSQRDGREPVRGDDRCRAGREDSIHTRRRITGGRARHRRLDRRCRRDARG